MAWVIASLPFWVSGLSFFPVASVCVFTERKPEETDEEIASQFLSSVVFGGILLLIAAWMCS